MFVWLVVVMHTYLYYFTLSLFFRLRTLGDTHLGCFRMLTASFHRKQSGNSDSIAAYACFMTDSLVSAVRFTRRYDLPVV